MAAIFEAWGLAYPVPLSYASIGEHVQYPWLHPSDMLRTIGSVGDFHMLLGGCASMQLAQGLLSEFWSRYEAICPRHTLFRRIRESGGSLQASQFLPILVHGDEGTTYKKNGMLVIQFAGAFGRGSRKTKEDQNTWQTDLQSCGIPLNLVQTALQTRFLTFLCPRELCWVMLGHIVCQFMSSLCKFGG